MQYVHALSVKIHHKMAKMPFKVNEVTDFSTY